MKKIFSGLAILAALTLFSHCSKKHDASPSKTSLLTRSAGWTPSSKKVNGVESIDDCDEDDVLKFSTAGTFTFNHGTDLCFVDEENENGTWEFNSAQTVITITEFGDDQDLTITTLNSTTLLLQFSDDGDTYILGFTAK